MEGHWTVSFFSLCPQQSVPIRPGVDFSIFGGRWDYQVKSALKQSYLFTEKNGFVAATKLGTTDNFFCCCNQKFCCSNQTFC